MSDVVCFRCMKVSVTSPGELCNRCDVRSTRSTVATLDEWTLADLIATQESGDVPGQAQYERFEVPTKPSLLHRSW